jgi:hypothetical protein
MFLSNLEYKFFWMALIMVALSRNVAGGEGRDPDLDSGGRHRLPPAPATTSPERLGQPL